MNNVVRQTFTTSKVLAMPFSFVAGCVGGSAGVMVGYPLDTIKVHLQSQDMRQPKYRGSVHCLRTIVAEEGVRGLYKGMTSPLSGVAAINAIVFGVYGTVCRALGSPDSLATHFVAGGIAGFVQSFICSPMELVKSRAQISKCPLGPLQCLKQIYRREGLRGVYRGLDMTIARETPGFGAYFLAYEYLTQSDGPISTGTMMVAGGMAGVVSWVVVYPVDVVKTRMQTDRRYTGPIDCLRRSVAVEGYSVLYRGLGPTVVRAFPVNATTFTVVTWTMRMLEGVKGSNDVVRDTETLWEKWADAITLKLSDLATV